MAAHRPRSAYLGVALVLVSVLVIVLSSAGEARADDGFALTDRPDVTKSTLSLDTSYSRLNAPLFDGFNSIRVEPNFVVYNRRRRALIAVLPLAIGRQGGETDVSVGNIEVGGFLVKRMRDSMWMVPRLSVALPTAPSTNKSAVTNGVAALSRVGDLVIGMPSTLSARASLSMVVAQGGLVARADFGVDVPLLEQSRLIDDLSRSPLARANLAIGFQRPGSRSQLSFESANVLNSEDILATFGVPERSATLHQLALTLRHQSETWSHVVALATDPRRLFGSDDGYVVTLVYQVAKPTPTRR